MKAAEKSFLSAYQRAIGALISIFFCYWCYLSLTITLHYYDSYEYFNSARALIGIGGYYDYTRPPGFPMLLTPLMLICKWSGSENWLTFAPHLFMVLISLLVILFCYHCWKKWFNKEISLILILLLILDRVFFHFTPFVQADILSIALVMATVHFSYQVTQSHNLKDACWAGIFLGLSVATKHYLAPICLIPTIFIGFKCFSLTEKRFKFQPIIWLSIIAIISAITALLLHRIAFWLIPQFRYQDMISIMRTVFIRGSSVNSMKLSLSTTSIAHTFILLGESLGWPLLIVSLFGMYIGIKQRSSLALINLIWTIIFLLIFTFIFEHREARYFLQVTPAFLFFIGLSIQKLIEEWHSTRVKLTGIVIAIISFATIFWGTIIEIKNFTDPVYQSDAVQRLSRELKQQIGPSNKVIWHGDLMAQLPEDNKFYANDEYDDPLYYLFSSHANAINYYINQPGFTLLYPLDFPPTLNEQLQPGDLIIVGTLRAEIKPPFPPLNIFRFQDYTIFEGPTEDNSKIVLKSKNNESLIAKIDNNILTIGSNGATLMGWELILNGNRHYSLKGIRIFPAATTTTIPLSQASKNSEIKGVIAVRLTQSISTFYY